MNATLNRREFLVVCGAGSFGFLLGISTDSARINGQTSGSGFKPNAFLEIAPDSRVTFWIPRIEMGQDVRTALAQILAEELGADLGRVGIRQGGPSPELGDLNTGGSSSIREFWLPLRRAGATAREMLLQAGASRWKTTPTLCRAEKGNVIEVATGKRFAFGELAAAAAKLPVPASVALKSPDQFSIVGKSVARLDGPDIVSGRAAFGIDQFVPGMLFAMMVRCPVYGGKVARFDASAALRVPGVQRCFALDNQAIQSEMGSWINGVAVVGDSTWATLQGREKLRITWEEGPRAGQSSATIRKDLKTAARQKGNVVFTQGNPAKALDTAAVRLQGEYDSPFLPHVTLEPMNCVVHWQGKACEVWAPVQYPGWARRGLARMTGLPIEAITIHPTLIGGGFGRRIHYDYILEAALISRKVGRPIKLTWTRRDDLQHDFYRPASSHYLEAGLDDSGQPVPWFHRIGGISNIGFSVPGFPKPEASEVWGAYDLPYRISNRTLEFTPVEAPIPVGYWRGVEVTQNCFITESFIDELAWAAKRDPYRFRRELLLKQGELSFPGFFPPDAPEIVRCDTTRLLKTLDLVVEKSEWDKPLQKGQGRGIACCAYSTVKTYVSQVVLVSVTPDAEIRVRKVYCVIDCGLVVNPDSVRAQIEGAVVNALFTALKGEITIEGGRVEQSNFGDYPLLRIDEMPEVEVFIVPSSEAPGGVGEPGVPPLAPALANAIFSATGKRLRRLPIKEADLV